MITSTQVIPPIIIGKYNELKPELKQKNNEKIDTEGQVSNSVISAKQNAVIADKKNSNSVTFNFREIEEKLSEALNLEKQSIRFDRDEETKQMIMKIIDNETHEVIHQYPPEISVKIARIVAKSLDNGIVGNAKV